MSRTYGQYCGLAGAMELVGERWGLLVVGDLVLGRPPEYRNGPSTCRPLIKEVAPDD